MTPFTVVKENDSLCGGEDNDLLFGNLGVDTLTGCQGDDFLYGGQENDSLTGGSGNDWVSGDLGNDTLTGGIGQDTFLLTSGNDLITDFEDTVDVLGLTAGITFEQLSIASENNSTIIRLTSNNEIIATLNGIDAALIGGNDFVAVV
jgi:Ca2+-binding RTX toxin-like protein